MMSLAVVEDITLKPKTSRALSTTQGGCGKAIVGFFGEAEAAGAGAKFFSSANSRAEVKKVIVLDKIHDRLTLSNSDLVLHVPLRPETTTLFPFGSASRRMR